MVDTPVVIGCMFPAVDQNHKPVQSRLALLGIRDFTVTDQPSLSFVTKALPSKEWGCAVIRDTIDYPDIYAYTWRERFLIGTGNFYTRFPTFIFSNKKRTNYMQLRLDSAGEAVVWVYDDIGFMVPSNTSLDKLEVARLEAVPDRPKEWLAYLKPEQTYVDIVSMILESR